MSKDRMQLFVGDTANLTANVLPEDADNKSVTWSSSNNEIVTVTNDGLVNAIKEGTAEIIAKSSIEGIEAKCSVTVKQINPEIILEFKEPLRIEADEISNLDINKLTVNEIKQLITTNLNMEIYDKDNVLLEEGDMIGTGSTLVLKDEDENEIFNYVFIIYGDVNGDGLINSLDVLIIQRHILETKPITGIFLKAGNISKNGALPSSLDVLKLQKHILEIKFIEQ